MSEFDLMGDSAAGQPPPGFSDSEMGNAATSGGNEDAGANVVYVPPPPPSQEQPMPATSGVDAQPPKADEPPSATVNANTNAVDLLDTPLPPQQEQSEETKDATIDTQAVRSINSLD